MGRRAGRKKTLKMKKEMLRHEGPSSVPGNGRYRWCRAHSQYIDISVCVVYQTRSDGQCYGCEHYGGEG